MDQPAFWVAVGAAVTAVGAALASYFNLKPKLDAMKFQIELLQASDARKDQLLLDCEAKHARMQQILIEMLSGKISSHEVSEGHPPAF